MDDLLFEVGCDEIPARYMPGAIDDLRKRAAQALREARFPYKNLSVWGTPRRLVLYVQGLAPVSEEAQFEVRGPSAKVAYDGAGEPTRALLGFSRSLGIDAKEVVLKKEKGGEYVYGLRREPGRHLKQALPEILPPVVLGMECPHPLRWGDEDWRWYRIVRWVLCLYGEQPIDVSLTGKKSGVVSFGHRAICPGPVVIPQAQQYFSLMERAGVIVDHERRKSIIEQGAMKLANSLGGIVPEDSDLLREVTFLSEHPVPFLGTFEQGYLTLPKEVLVTVMRFHQRYFPVVDGKGNILPGFVGVKDGDPDLGMESVRAGNEWVLKARLSDAKFFYSQDLKVRLNERLPELKGVGFMRNAGSMHDKAFRIKEIGETYASHVGLSPEERDAVSQASLLAKCDLVTHMVGEFPELEGIMGGHYAKVQGFSDTVSDAITDHYLPKLAQDSIPQRGPGAILSLADKMDTLAVAFCAGAKTTGSEDPLGLRRAALGVVKVLIGHRYELPRPVLLDGPMALAASLLGSPNPAAKDRLWDFLLNRVEGLLTGLSYPIELVRAVLGGREARICRFEAMVSALSALSKTPKLSQVVSGWRRTSVLSKDSQVRDVTQRLLIEEPEMVLCKSFQTVKGPAEDMFERGDYLAYLNLLADLGPDIDRCLDEVLIMAEDPQIRVNRLALLGGVADLFTTYGDFSHVLPLLP